MAKFTVWVMETSRRGTCYVTSMESPDIETAKTDAVDECCGNWGDGYEPKDVFVLGVAKGNICMLEWNDE